MKVRFSLLLFLVAFSSCIPMKTVMKWTSWEEEAIPTDFGKDESRLLILTGDKERLRNSIETNLNLYYTGRYDYISAEELKSIDNTGYKDKVEYRYLLGYEREDMGGESTPLFYIQDRKSGQKYRPKQNYDNFNRILQCYFKNLEARRKVAKN